MWIIKGEKKRGKEILECIEGVIFMILGFFYVIVCGNWYCFNFFEFISVVGVDRGVSYFSVKNW